MKSVQLLVPEAWIERIDKAKGGQSRNLWIRAVIRDALIMVGVWPDDEDEVSVYRRLEQQIQTLWNSRGMEVLEEGVSSLGNGKFMWTITAKQKETT